jgi:hypothetical protein
VDSKLQKTFKVGKEKKTKQEKQIAVVSIFHQNVQSINNKLLELNIMLQTELEEDDVLCLSKNWLKEEYIKLISIDKLKLAGILVEAKVFMVVPVYMSDTICKQGR